MAPEAPGNLVVVDARFDEDGDLVGDVESVDISDVPRASIDAINSWLFVYWNNTPTGEDYIPVSGGVVFVEQPLPQGYRLVPASPFEPTHSGGGRYSYRYPALGEGLMFVLILPESYTLTNPRPTPRAAKLFKQRLAVYWKPSEKYGKETKISWMLTKFHGNPREERDRVNSAIDRAEDAPDNQGAYVDQLGRQRRREWDKPALRELLNGRFSLNELRTIAIDLNYGDAEGKDKSTLARDLIDHLARREQIDRLIAWIKRFRPDINCSAFEVT
ncbi:MAG: hypothetical protein U0768_09530 [Anaerolineae bacterium]